MGLDQPTEQFLALTNPDAGDNAYRDFLGILLKHANEGLHPSDREKLEQMGVRIRESKNFPAVKRDLLDLRGVARLPVEAIGRLLGMMKPVFGLNPASQGWSQRAQAAIGTLSPSFTQTVTQQAQAYNERLEQDEGYRQLLADHPDPRHWDSDQREFAVRTLARHAAHAMGLNGEVKAEYGGEPIVAHEGSMMITDLASSKITAYSGALQQGELTVWEGLFHEVSHVLQNRCLAAYQDPLQKPGLFTLPSIFRDGKEAPPGPMNNPDVLRLLRVAHGSEPATRGEMSWLTMSESISYRLGLIAALCTSRIAGSGSFLSDVSKRLAAGGHTEDPWQATQGEMQRQVSGLRNSTTDLSTLMHTTGEGRLQAHPEAASLLWSINEVCARGERRFHGRLTHKALMPLWIGVVHALDKPSHPDRNLAQTFDKALTLATQGRLEHYVEQFGFKAGVIPAAHEKGTLIRGLSMLANRNLDPLGKELVMQIAAHALGPALDDETLAQYRTALQLPAEPQRSAAASSSRGVNFNALA